MIASSCIKLNVKSPLLLLRAPGEPLMSLTSSFMGDHLHPQETPQANTMDQTVSWDGEMPSLFPVSVKLFNVYWNKVWNIRVSPLSRVPSPDDNWSGSLNVLVFVEIISIPAGGEDEVNLPLSAQSCAGNAALLKSSGPGPLLWKTWGYAVFWFHFFGFIEAVWQGEKGLPDIFKGEAGDLKYCNAGKHLVYMHSTGVSPSLGCRDTVELPSWCASPRPFPSAFLPWLMPG